MFDKILIANRGEIACRVMRTARRMGIATVAVYSEADRYALHVAMADEAVCIGPARSSESYLVIEAILRAVRETGAQAVHPGYGFLSENAAFAERLAAEAVVFIGPGAGAITAMGDKITAKKLAGEAGVNIISGHPEAVGDEDEAIAIAADIGFPVMLKASAGGGGKGMRIAHDEAGARDGFRSATREAKSSFGDDRVFLEKFIEQPRHIEIQVLADSHGNTLYLGERECSIQRRHQKVIEEAPSPFLDEATRRAMGTQAVTLARAVDYTSAGTVEFIVDAERNFYFLEMNTRLQVEHPVTELVTGLDLVEQMIRIAAGQELAFSQADVRLDGWAVEARIYAEDPLRGFLPSVGRLVRYAPPEETEARVDTGVHEGGEISIHYDPMIAKVVTHGADRQEAIERMRHALDGFVIRGVAHNIGFLAALMAHPRFVEGRLSTEFIAEEYADGFCPSDMTNADPVLLAAIVGTLHRIVQERAACIGGQLPGHERKVGENVAVVLDGESHEAKVTEDGGTWRTATGGRTFHIVTDWTPGRIHCRCEVDGVPHILQVERAGAGYRLAHGGFQAEVLALSPRAAGFHALMPPKKAPDTSRTLLSPMPGLLISLAVEIGQTVEAGEELAVIEAMKMENVLRAERDGTVVEVHARPGDSLAVDQAIVEFE
jgi:propionyl-CoA carboxylase alpha chain